MAVDLHRMALRPLAMWISLDGHLDHQEILQQTTRDPSVPLKKKAGLLVFSPEISRCESLLSLRDFERLLVGCYIISIFVNKLTTSSLLVDQNERHHFCDQNS